MAGLLLVNPLGFNSIFGSHCTSSALDVKQHFVFITYKRATLARSLHDVSRKKNNRFAVIICFNSAHRALRMRKIENFELKQNFPNFGHHDEVIIR